MKMPKQPDPCPHCGSDCDELTKAEREIERLNGLLAAIEQALATPTQGQPGPVMTATQTDAQRLSAWLNEGGWHQMRLVDVESAGRELRRLDSVEKDYAQLKAVLHAALTAQPAPMQERSVTATDPQPASDKLNAIEAGWLPIKGAPRNGTNILLRFGQDGVSLGAFVPGLPLPWKFIDTQQRPTWLINFSVDGPGGPSHYKLIELGLTPPVQKTQGGAA